MINIKINLLIIKNKNNYAKDAIFLRHIFKVFQIPVIFALFQASKIYTGEIGRMRSSILYRWVEGSCPSQGQASGKTMHDVAGILCCYDLSGHNLC